MWTGKATTREHTQKFREKARRRDNFLISGGAPGASLDKRTVVGVRGAAGGGGG